MRKKKTFEYTSYCAAEFNGFLQYRISGGSNGLEERRVLKSLDDYLIQSGMVKKKLDGIIVDAWINSLNVGGNTKAHYVSVYRQFAHYLTGLGYKAYIPPPLQIKRNYTPYVFTSEEMKRLFEACDNIPARRSLTKAEVWLPVMVRMLYGCGLRVGEAVSLQNKDIDWTEGTLLIRAAKGNKDRLVPMSNSLIDVCRTYHSIAHPFPNSEDFFFYNHKKQPLSTLTPYIWLRRALEIAGIDRHPYPKQLRGVCVHCLRHTFAVHTLQLQSKRGIDRFYSVPILSTYMGHTDIYGTELYLRLTPECYEHIVDCAEKDTGDIFPEVLP